MSALQEQHSRWDRARARLWGEKPQWFMMLRHFKDIKVAAHYAFDPSTHPYRPKWQIIAQECADKHGVTVGDLSSQRRDKAAVAARHEAFWRCRRETNMSLPTIGRRFGGRDHTTVMSGVKAHERRMAALGESTVIHTIPVINVSHTIGSSEACFG